MKKIDCNKLTGDNKEECELFQEAIKNEKKNKEFHLPFYNFCGPGTKVVTRLNKGDTGINKLDNACKVHDVDYYVHAGDNIALQNSDDNLRKAAKEIGGVSGWIVEKAFALKRKGENLGLFTPASFTDRLSNNKNRDKIIKIGKYLRKKYINNDKVKTD